MFINAVSALAKQKATRASFQRFQFEIVNNLQTNAEQQWQQAYKVQ